MTTNKLTTGALTLGGYTILDMMPEHLSVEEDHLGAGVFVRAIAERAASRCVFSLGTMPLLRRFAACYRDDLFFVTPRVGTCIAEIPVETQFLVGELEGGAFVVVLPILDPPFRTALEGNAQDELLLVAETGDRALVGSALTGVFIAVGDDPYALMASAAKSVMARMQTGRLREEKPLPRFVEHFGWCTWDAFYQDVSLDKVREGLESFRAGGVQPTFLILDDGWQPVRTFPAGEKRLTAFAANEKFPGDLAPTVAMAKGKYGIESFFVWHALLGYWGGVDPDAFPQYRVANVAQTFSPGIWHYRSQQANEANVYLNGLVTPDAVHRFYQDYHRHLRLQGVDGVKIDCQAVLEVLGDGQGGRLALMRAYHEALEGSVQTQLLGEVINCMSCSTDMLYSALNSTVTRSSTDFMPRKPETQGLHVYTNALASYWMGEFVHPDWDMFQSAHPAGAFHAAARAISGGPVYVSDKPDAHDFALLRKLVLSDGTVLRAQEPGRLTRDCLLHDPTQEDLLLKIFTRNRYGGVVGAFNAQHHAAADAQRSLPGVVRPSDVEGLVGEDFIVYAH
ncbi:MAG TPA: Sip1-related alpha-galactosidase, partial [Armatimonadota bacterium]